MVKQHLTLRKAKVMAQQMLVSTLLLRAARDEIERRGLKPNELFTKMENANDARTKLPTILPQLGMSFVTTDESFPYTVRYKKSFPFVLASEPMWNNAKAQAKLLTEEFYTQMTTTDTAPIIEALLKLPENIEFHAQEEPVAVTE